MNLAKHTLLRFMFAALTVCALQACGQKGPLEVERPQVQQEEELQETK